ncbi:GNAT family N-acetyltransferase [Pseudomonas carnis]|nr:GNAT family N-acetyltransferase [Pseudomonas carnis]
MPVDTHAIRILSQRLNIEPFCEQDAVESSSCISPSLTRYMSWEPPASLEEYAQVWGRWLPAIADGSDIVFTIRERVGARFIGLVGLHHTGSETPELGIWVREDKHGLGFGGEAVWAVVQWASEWVVAKHFVYPVATQNRASRRIAEALGGGASSRGGWRRNMIRLCTRYRGFNSGCQVGRLLPFSSSRNRPEAAQLT